MSSENESAEINQTRSYQFSHALSQRLSILRWLVLLVGLFMALLHQVMQGSFRLGGLPRWEASGGLLLLTEENSPDLKLQVETGQSLGESFDLVKDLARGAFHAEHALIINDLAQHGSPGVRSLLIAPVHISNQTLGSMVLWTTKPDAFNRHRGQLVANWWPLLPVRQRC